MTGRPPRAAIIQQAVAPWTMTCRGCGRTWLPRPARGNSAPTAASLDAAAREHWAICPGTPDAGEPT